jgi:hypothetical protein
MQELIKIIGQNLFLINSKMLGLQEAQLWIGPDPDGPADDDDARVIKSRQDSLRQKSLPGFRISGIDAVLIRESPNYPGWYKVNTADWMPDKYRFTPHGKAGVQSPNGSKIEAYRDGEYSWPTITDTELLSLSDEQKKFIYLERNKRGYCFRILKEPNGDLSPAGDGLAWIHDWPNLKKARDEYFEQLRNKTKTT